MSTMLIYLLAALGQVSGQANDEPRAREQTGAGQASLARMAADLRAFEVSIGSGMPRKLSLREEPVLRWSYPIRKLDDGALFVWLDEDRPEAIEVRYGEKVIGQFEQLSGQVESTGSYHIADSGPLEAGA